jgi:predicted molibdopterin-dependent oxidoreductase YjgC
MTNPITDFAKSDCIFVIGSNFAENHPIIARWVLDAKQHGATLIVADPRFTSTAWTADIFLPLIPGTDTMLLNSMMYVIISEKLYNPKFVDSRTTGFEALCNRVNIYTPHYAEQLTEIPADRIIDAARAYATAQAASIIYCMGVTQHTCGTDTVVNCANLAMLCGQIGRPGTGVNPLRGQDNVQGACDMGALPTFYSGYQPVTDAAMRGKFASAWGCPADELSSKPGLTLVEMTNAVDQGSIRAMLIMGENPLVVDPNSAHVRHAFEHLDFLAIMELFMTETAELADVILPAASFAEKRGTKTATDRRVQWMDQAIAPRGEARHDWQIVSDLAARLGLHQYFAYATEEEILAEIARVTPSYAGITPARLQDTLGGIPWPCPSVDHPGTPILYTDGFKKPDGRGIMLPVECRLPCEEITQDYPLILTSGRVVMHYNSGTMTRRTRALMNRETVLFVQIHPATARQYGIGEGWVKVITARGEAVAKTKISRQIPEGVVFMPFHFPETNLLTIDALDPTAKIPEYKVAACRIESLQCVEEGA